jgi:hypothetical protein
MFRPQFFLLLGGCEDADSQRLGEIKLATGLRRIIAGKKLVLHYACYRHPEDGLRRIDGTASCKRDAGPLTRFATTALTVSDCGFSTGQPKTAWT